MNDFESRINLNLPLEDISLKICNAYGLGEFISNKLIEIGYEDFNYILTTSKNKFVVKIFSNERTNNDAKDLVNRASVALENGISSPAIYKTILSKGFVGVLLYPHDGHLAKRLVGTYRQTKNPWILLLSQCKK